MITRAALIRSRRDSWDRLEELLRRAERKTGAHHLDPNEIKTLGELYRALASDLMRTRRDRLGADLERYLDGLAARSHNLLHAGRRARRRDGTGPLDLLLDFPGALRRNARLFLLATILFYAPGLVSALVTLGSEPAALELLGPGQLASLEEMYRLAPNGRDPAENSAMTGFYVWNNVGIAFRCFATGILFGLGSIWFLVSNGVFLGAALGHLGRVGLFENIAQFVSIHGPWELTAIVISGAAGLQMGTALILTGGRTRIGSLQRAGWEVLRQVSGAAAFLVLAAALEGWASPSALGASTKYALGGVGWALVIALLVFGGRGRSLPPDLRGAERAT